ncbi:MAG: sigma-70 family RNA polymerase sigma factor [Altererythrobacter sp.]|nr:sigma-70 family RNA polymerase sigma factor [Altererythrobacter sp.]OJU60992.1 MAG: hypothetical protein BGO08_12810 [Altererythrobacter sp. 66-12]
MIQDHQQFSAATAYGGNVGERVTRFLPMVRRLAWHLSGSGGPAIDVDDLVQAGLVALTECAQRHERPTEDGFAAYAKLRVRGAMVDLLRSASPEPRGARARRRRIEEAQARLASMLGRDPSSGELAEALGMPVDELHRVQGDAVHLASIDDCYSESDLAFAAEEVDAEAALLQHEDREQLIEAIAALPERQQLVIQLYFVEELNLAEIAMVLGVSVPRVHQLKAAALDKLRLAFAAQG